MVADETTDFRVPFAASPCVQALVRTSKESVLVGLQQFFVPETVLIQYVLYITVNKYAARGRKENILWKE